LAEMRNRLSSTKNLSDKMFHDFKMTEEKVKSFIGDDSRE